MRIQRPARIGLSVGTAVGVLLATAGALVPTGNDFSGNVLARVNGKAITSQDVEFAFERIAGDTPATQAQRLETLQRLIDQELLIQRGVEIGLLESDLTVRKAIAMAMIDASVAKALAQDPAEEDLRAFYDSHLAVFTVPARVHVQQIYCDGNGNLSKAGAQAEQASAAITRGLSFTEARAQYGNEDSLPVPDALVPAHVLLRHLGPALTQTVLALRTGEISPPLQSSAGYHILRLVEQRPEQVQPYEAVKQEVRAEYLRRRRDEALQHELDRLRQEATIVLSPKAPWLDIVTQAESSGGP